MLLVFVAIVWELVWDTEIIFKSLYPHQELYSVSEFPFFTWSQIHQGQWKSIVGYSDHNVAPTISCHVLMENVCTGGWVFWLASQSDPIVDLLQGSNLRYTLPLSSQVDGTVLHRWWTETILASLSLHSSACNSLFSLFTSPIALWLLSSNQIRIKSIKSLRVLPLKVPGLPPLTSSIILFSGLETAALLTLNQIFLQVVLPLPFFSSIILLLRA